MYKRRGGGAQLPGEGGAGELGEEDVLGARFYFE